MSKKREKSASAINTGMQYRVFDLQRADVDTESRTVPLSFSSEDPYKRWWGTEILDHSNGAVRLDRIRKLGPLLVDHDHRDQVGVIEDVQIAKDKIGRAVVRFGKSARAEEIYQDVLDGIRGNVSVGYQIHKMKLVEETETDEIYRAVDWEPFEISLVSVPADTSVGVGRSAEGDHITVIERNETDQQQINEPDISKEDPDKQIKEQKTMSEVEVKEKIEVKEDTAARRQRDIEKINELADKHDAHQLALTAIRNGQSLEEFVCSLLERQGAKKVTDTAEIGMTKQEQKRYSIVRALNALANPQSKAFQEAAAFERECSEAAEKKYSREAQGLIIPADVLMSTARRDLLTVGTAADGGNLVGTDHLAGSFIDALRNRTMVMKMGARLLDGLVGNVAIPKLSAGATAYWVDADSTTGPSETKQTFGQVSMAPKTVGAVTDISRQLLRQSSPSVDALVETDLQKILAIAIDRAALHGTGSSNQPQGIAGTSGIGSVVGGTNGAAPTWAHIVSLWTEVAVDNADIGSLGFMTNSKVVGKLMTTEKAEKTAQFVCQSFPNADGFTSLAGMRTGVSNQVAGNLTKGSASGVASAIFFGNWSDLIIGAWGGLDLTADPYTHSDSGALRVVALQDIDIAVRHAQSFAAMLDALTA